MTTIRGRMTATLGLALALVLGGCTQLQALTGKSDTIEVTALPIALRPDAPSEDTVDKLHYRGGLYLRSKAKGFGGFSGLLVSADGARLLAVSDEGHWLSAVLRYKDGRLVGMDAARLAPMLGLDGKPLQGKSESDAEAVTAASPQGMDGALFVSFEHHHRIWRYPFGVMGMAAVPEELPTPEDLPRAAVNGGIEALSVLDGTELLALTEDTRDRQYDLKGWLIPLSTNPKDSHIVFLKADGTFQPTDLAVAPDGSLLLLERSFTPQTGAAMQIRRIARKDVQPLAAFSGEVIARLDVRYSIDNMEGIAVRRDENGKTLIYLISDDNFSGLQRTVLLMFELDSTGLAPAPAVPVAKPQ